MFRQSSKKTQTTKIQTDEDAGVAAYKKQSVVYNKLVDFSLQSWLAQMHKESINALVNAKTFSDLIVAADKLAPPTNIYLHQASKAICFMGSFVSSESCFAYYVSQLKADILKFSEKKGHSDRGESSTNERQSLLPKEQYPSYSSKEQYPSYS